MDWIIGLSLIIVGAIVGFFAAKYFLTQSKAEVEQSKSAISERELLTEHALIHASYSKIFNVRATPCNLSSMPTKSC